MTDDNNTTHLQNRILCVVNTNIDTLLACFSSYTKRRDNREGGVKSTRFPPAPAEPIDSRSIVGVEERGNDSAHLDDLWLFQQVLYPTQNLLRNMQERQNDRCLVA